MLLPRRLWDGALISTRDKATPSGGHAVALHDAMIARVLADAAAHVASARLLYCDAASAAMDGAMSGVTGQGRAVVMIATVMAMLAACMEQGRALPDEVALAAQAGGDVDVGRSGAPWLRDEHIAALVPVLNRSIMDAARLQLQNWSSDSIARLALQILQDHAAVNSQLDSVMRVRGVAPVVPAVAADLDVRHAVHLDSIRGLTGRALERRYLQQQQQAHMAALQDFAALGELASDPDLRALLRERVVVMEQLHLRRVEDALRQVAVADSAAQARRGGQRP
jgi:predicted outer membrane protein